jgi:two-component system, NtrC family, nitrogen regulation sensor histidine kinase NtrY
MESPPVNSKARISFETRVTALALVGGLPAVILAVHFTLAATWPAPTRYGAACAIAIFWAVCGLAAHRRIERPLQTIANLIAAIREGDYTVRARPRASGALGAVVAEINRLSAVLCEARLGEQEAGTLLRAVLRDLDVAVFAFDRERRLCLINRAGERLLNAPAASLLRQTAGELHLEACLTGERRFVLECAFPGAAGHWEVRRSPVREDGLPLDLVVIADITRALAERDLQAWQRVVRVLGHELNNSLTPVMSIAASLESLLARAEPPADWRDDMRHGLGIIRSRSEGLARFVGAYARLAKLPRPQIRATELAPILERAARMETRVPVTIAAPPPTSLLCDPDQIEQALINLLRNAAEAAPAGAGHVAISTCRDGAMVEIAIEDNGAGIAATENLFVPFFTTKPGGSGIGLVLSRHVAEAHGGTLTLENRVGAQGCIARLRLPCLGA